MNVLEIIYERSKNSYSILSYFSITFNAQFIINLSFLPLVLSENDKNNR